LSFTPCDIAQLVQKDRKAQLLTRKKLRANCRGDLTAAAHLGRRSGQATCHSWNKDHDLQKTRAFVTAAIMSSQTLNRFMISYRGDPELTSEWAGVKTELTALAVEFKLPAIRW